MFKSIVTQLAKTVWDNAGKMPVPATISDSQTNLEVDTQNPARSNLNPDTLGIELPYYPKIDTDCGDACRCAWSIDVRWSEEHAADALFATWNTAEDDEVCPDCLRRQAEWQNVFIRLLES